jgi:hypothetical protein
MSPEPSHKRAITFVDGQNLYHGAREAFGHAYPNYDVLALARRICQDAGWEPVQVRFYTGIPDPADDPFWNRFWVGGEGKPACLPMHFHEMQALQADRGLLDYSALVVSEARWEDLDPLEFERFRRFIRESQGRGDTSLMNLPDLELAKALGAVEANGQVRRVRVAGLLLFGREEALRRQLPPSRC